MTEQEKVRAIVDEYGESFSGLSNNGTVKEPKAVMRYIADQASERQRQLVGLED